MDFQIPLDSFTDIQFGIYPKDFVFIVNDKIYETSRFIADIISPLIKNSPENYFILETTNKDFDFSTFLECSDFSKHRIQVELIPDFLEITSKLRNEAAYLSIHQVFSQNITKSNVLDRINIKRSFIKDFNRDTPEYELINKEFLKEEIDYAISHFSEFSNDEMRKFSEETFLEIINSESFPPECNDTLLNFAISCYQKDESLTYYFPKVDYTKVSPDLLFKFMNLVDLESAKDIWTSLKAKFYDPAYNVKGPKTIDLTAEDGVFTYIHKARNADLYENKIIEVITKPNKPVNAKQIFNYDKNLENIFVTTNEPNSSITFKLDPLSLQITSYEITSCKWVKFSNHLRSWVVEISVDGEKWTEIDAQNDCESLNGSNLTCKFDIKTKVDFAKYIRLRTTSTDWRQKNFLAYNRLEFYGILEVPMTLVPFYH